MDCSNQKQVDKITDKKNQPATHEDKSIFEDGTQ